MIGAPFFHFLNLTKHNMHPKIHSSQFSAYLVQITLLILAILVFSSFSATLEEHYVNCAPLNSTCGDSLNITYPFWVSSRPSYCGHPAFKLDCQSNGFTILIKNQTFRVLSLNYASDTLAISKQAFSESLCPETTAEITNSSLDFTFFDFAPKSQNVTVLYNCSTARISDTSSYFIFGCPGNAFSHTIVSGINYIETREDKRALDKLKCRIEIVLPVLGSEVTKLSDRLDNVNDVASKGFEVSWKANQRECKVCLQSGGRCGYNETLRLPVCFCKDSVYPDVCQLPSALQGHGKKKHGTVIGIAVGVVTGSVILVVIVCLLYRRYKKNQLSEYIDSQNKIPNKLSTAFGPNESTYFGLKVFDIAELQEATNDFSPTKELGRGGFGTVYLGTLRDGREVAIKRMYERSNRRVDQFLNEVEILANLHHQNLVILYGCSSHQCNELVLVYEYVSNGTCGDHLHGEKANLGLLSWPKRLKIAIETASAVVYLHSSDVVHRDIKTENILLDDDFSVKVCDFGLARLFPVDVTHVSTSPQGTPGYVDPEYYQTYHLNEKSDVYSFGVVLAELISSKPAVDITRQRADINLFNMLKNKILTSSLDQFVDPFLDFGSDNIKKEITAVAELAFQCLEGTREMRPTMQQVLDQLCSIQGKEDTSSEIVEAP